MEAKMSFFVDSGVWIAAFNKKDEHHSVASKIIPHILQEQFEKVYISDYVFDEVTTYIRKKISPEASILVAEAMLNSQQIEIIFVSEKFFNASYHIFKMYDQLSFTDASIVVLMKNRKISYLYSFDSGFDSIKDIRRLIDV
ncbi:MAG: type II toxin-antitoxin system VapC family toxin [Promethearchaeota archaeon]